MILIMNKIMRTLLLLTLPIAVSLCVYAQSESSYFNDVGAVEGTMFIDIVGEIPEVNFVVYEEEKKILIELLKTQYSSGFVFDIPTKRNILEGLEFAEDVSIGSAKYGNGNQKIGIWLSVGDDEILLPKVTSSDENGLIISFEKKEIVDDVAPVEEGEEVKKQTLSNEEVILDLYNMAVEAHAMNNLAKAESLYREVLLSDKNFYQASYNLSCIHIENNQYNEALTLLRELAKKFSSDNLKNETMFLLVSNAVGVIHYYQDDLKKAEQIFKDLLTINDSYFETYYNLGLVYEKQHDIKKAKANFNKAIEFNSNHVPSYYHLGVLSLLLKDKKEAISHFKRVVEFDPSGKYAKLSQDELYELQK